MGAADGVSASAMQPQAAALVFICCVQAAMGVKPPSAPMHLLNPNAGQGPGIQEQSKFSKDGNQQSSKTNPQHSDLSGGDPSPPPPPHHLAPSLNMDTFGFPSGSAAQKQEEQAAKASGTQEGGGVGIGGQTATAPPPPPPPGQSKAAKAKEAKERLAEEEAEREEQDEFGADLNEAPPPPQAAKKTKKQKEERREKAEFDAILFVLGLALTGVAATGTAAALAIFFKHQEEKEHRLAAASTYCGRTSIDQDRSLSIDGESRGSGRPETESLL